MFDLTSTKLLILALVALVVVGPKDFPVLLRTIGKYMGVLKRHADDFRAQFDQALREAELADMKTEVERMSREIEASVREADKVIASGAAEAARDMEESLTAGKIEALDMSPAHAPVLANDALTSPLAVDVTAAAEPASPPAVTPQPNTVQTASPAEPAPAPATTVERAG